MNRAISIIELWIVALGCGAQEYSAGPLPRERYCTTEIVDRSDSVFDNAGEFDALLFAYPSCSCSVRCCTEQASGNPAINGRRIDCDRIDLIKNLTLVAGTADSDWRDALKFDRQIPPAADGPKTKQKRRSSTSP
jgi:hypothetical protein